MLGKDSRTKGALPITYNLVDSLEHFRQAGDHQREAVA